MEKPIFRWGAINASDRLGKLNVSRSRVEYERFYLGLVEQIRNIFLDLVIYRTSLENRTSEEQILRMRIDNQEKRKELGALSEDEHKLSRIGLEETLLAIQRTRTAIERALRHFHLITGTEEWDIQDFPTSVPQISYSHARVTELLKSYLDMGVAGRFDWLIKLNEIERAKHGLTIDRARNRPSLDLFLLASQEKEIPRHAMTSSHSFTSEACK